VNRVLTMAQRSIDAGELTDFYDMVRLRRAYFEAAGCRYWVFQERGVPGTIIEFAEGPDENTLASALRSHSGDSFNGPIYTEVETR
jgi:hypothetical protein